jgi:hypothetical protein
MYHCSVSHYIATFALYSSPALAMGSGEITVAQPVQELQRVKITQSM